MRHTCSMAAAQLECQGVNAGGVEAKKGGDAFDKGASSVIATRGGGIHSPLHVSMLIFLESKLFVVANC